MKCANCPHRVHAGQCGAYIVSERRWCDCKGQWTHEPPPASDAVARTAE
jgi:hypothetical protein